MIARMLVLWVGMALLAIANGTFRVTVLHPRLGADAAHVASTLLLCVVIASFVWGTIRWLRPSSARSAWLLGGTWVTLTILFEFGVGRLVSHKPWSELLLDYDVTRGRVWPLVLLVIGIAPYAAASARDVIRREPGAGHM